MVEQTNKQRGLLINIEGSDGSGKSSIIEALKKFTFSTAGRNVETVFTRAPGGSDFAEKMRHACLNEDLSVETQTLFYTSLINDCFEKVIHPALDQGKVVISDRGYGSTLAYQGVSQNSTLLLESILTNQCGRNLADLTIYLDIPLEVAISRESGEGRSEDRYSKLATVEKKKIKEAYDLLYRGNWETRLLDYDVGYIEYLASLTTRRIIVVDASMPFQDVVNRVESIIQNEIFTQIHT